MLLHLTRLIATVTILCAISSQVSAQDSSWLMEKWTEGSSSGTLGGEGLNRGFSPTNTLPSKSVSSWVYGNEGDGNANANSNGVIVYRFTWRPKNNDPVLDPPPPYVFIRYRPTVRAEAYGWIYADVEGGIGGGGSNATATCDSLTADATVEIAIPNSYSIDTDYDYDEDDRKGEWKFQRIPVSNGVALKSIPYSVTTTSNLACDHALGYVHHGHVDSIASVDVEMRILPIYLGRNHGRGQDQTSGQSLTDPSFTRWLPLSFSPQINSEPIRTVPTYVPHLSKPWGNINCMYSIRVSNLMKYYNFPYSLTIYDNFHTEDPAFPKKVVGAWYGGVHADRVIFDADGRTLNVFDNLDGIAPYSDVRSDFYVDKDPSENITGFRLLNAGPPGHIRERGNYDYYFDHAGNLITIADRFGNSQVLNWNSAQTGPFLTVIDSTSGRQLIFYRNALGYVSSVVAPHMGGTLPAVRTDVNLDSYGHMLSLKVHEGSAGNPVLTNTFIYGLTGTTSFDMGAPLDPITAATVGKSVQETTYAQGGVWDIFNGYTFYKTQSRLGSPSDTSSSDGGSVQGIINYYYGMLSGIHYGGVDGRTNRITDARGNLFEFLYHYMGDGIDEIKLTAPAFYGANDQYKVTQKWLPSQVRPAEVQTILTDNRTWKTTLDENTGLPTRVYDPNNRFWEFTWGGTQNSDLTALMDPTGITWNFEYTSTGGNLTRVIDPGGQTRLEMTYNDFGQVATATSDGITKTLHYNAVSGDLLRILRGTNVEWVAGIYNVNTDSILANSDYDALGDLLAFTIFPDTGDATTSLVPFTTQIAYNAAQLPIQILAPTGNAYVPRYDNGVVDQIKIVNQSTTLVQIDLKHDTRGRLYEVKDGLGDLYEVRYDKNSNITRIIDGRGNATTLSYGANNEPTGLSWPGGGIASALYDKFGRVVQTTDERGVVVQYTYYPTDRLYQVIYPSDPGRNTTYNYDFAGRPLNIYDASGNSVVYQYDPVRKRLTSITITQDLHIYTISYQYNIDGTLQNMTSPMGATAYTHTARGQLNTLTNPHGETTTWQYDGGGRILSQSTNTGLSTISTVQTYGISGQAGDPVSLPIYLRKVEVFINGALYSTATRTHSYLGQLTALQVQTTVPFLTSYVTATHSETYQYDLRGRLSNFTSNYFGGTGGSGFATSGAYTYDLANNLLGNGGGWTYNASNQVTAAPTNANMSGANNLTYDNAGNLTHINNQTLVWDTDGNLKEVQGTYAGTVSYTYDLLGRRATRSVNGVLNRRYLYDGLLLIAELNGSGNTISTYTWGSQGLISDRTGGASRFYLYDSTANTRNLLDASGNSLWRTIGNTPYGKDLTHSRADANPAPSPFAFCGRVGAYRDDYTGLIRMGARDYSPLLGRFISRDPSLFYGGINVYGYCLGDPINFCDPTGEAPHIIVMIIGGAGVGGVVGGVVAYMNGEPIWAGFAKGAMQGAVAGGVMALAGPAACAGIGPAMGFGALSGALENLVGQAMDFFAGDTRSFDGKSFVRDSFFGAIFASLGKLGGFLCFTADTPVQVVQPDGTVITRRIADIQAGDRVMSKNPRTGEVSPRKVLSTSKNTAHELVTLSLADPKTGNIVEVIEATPEHPFFTPSGMVSAGNLGIGTEIVTRAGPHLVVQAVAKVTKPQGVAVYNLEVEKDQTYFVGNANGGAWVHNSCSPTNYPVPDPDMGIPPVRYKPTTITEVILMREGKSPKGKAFGADSIEAHHRQQVPVRDGGILDEITRYVHRMDGNHIRHDRPSRLTPSQRIIEIRNHWKKRGAEYLLPGEGI